MLGATTLFIQRFKLMVGYPEAGEMTSQTQALALTLNRQLETYGYCLSETLLNRLMRLNEENLKTWSLKTLSMIEHEIGIRPNQEPFYPNFPEQVIESSDMELYFNALCHYWSLGEWKPSTKKQSTFPLVDVSALKIIELGEEVDHYQLFKQKCSSVAGINESDQAYVCWFIDTYPHQVSSLLTETLPHRETATFLAAQLMGRDDVELSDFIKNATEVLRLATYLSGGDIHLKKPCRFKSFKRSERRLLMSLLANVKHDITEELWSRRPLWLRFSEKVHPLEFKQYPSIQKKFKALHEGKKPQTFNGKMEKLIQQKNIIGLCHHLVTRPAVFARQLDRVLRLESTLAHTSTNYPSFVLFSFKQIVHDLSVPILLNLWTHFQHRQEEKGFRAFFPKGSLSKCYGVEGDLSPLPNAIVLETVCLLEEALISSFAQHEPLGNVYLDPTLKQYAIPFSQRTSSKSLQTIARYSRLDVSGSSCLRPFIYWKEATGERCDLDLSLMVFDETFKIIETVAYYNLLGRGMTHSGDFVSAKEGAAEYIDINPEIVKQNGGRYGVILVHSYSLTPFCELPDCFVGVMKRDGFSGETFEPKTIAQRFDLATDGEVCVPAIIDFKTEELIWLDMGMTSGYVFNNAANTSSAAHYLLACITTMHRPTLYDLFHFHVLARQGELVEAESEAEQVFGGKTGIQPWDYNEILAEWLS